ncbi:hypothetical protein [Streptomyces broussonetiae]|uniref:Uncharacterized protein n=1 Tax=Streptomyces broussonetiae TaxID=2686304 RepID=A0A6I6N6P3_9ACTN|nr:hypothetical protein [Streptomyces broussonetiae]QHA08868.1 hypothetical protein GQF42_41445 [Streptomyces broussonetiae]
MKIPNAAEDRPDWRVRVLVGLYPPVWRHRYATEFAALLEDSGVGVRQVVDVAAAAVRVWARPSTHLHDRTGRMCTTVAVTLCAWTALAAGAVVFAKTTRDGAWYVTGHTDPAAGWYNVYALASATSALAIAVGWLPPVAAVLRAPQGHPGRRRARLLLLAPPVAVSAFLGAAAVLRLITHGVGVGPTGFLVLVGLGLFAGAAFAAGPAAALRHVTPSGAGLRVATVAGAVATTLMAVAVAASVGWGLVTFADRPGFTALTGYGTVMAVTLVVAATSSARGLRAAIARTRGSVDAH